MRAQISFRRLRLLCGCLLAWTVLPVLAQERDSVALRKDTLPASTLTAPVRLASPRRELPVYQPPTTAPASLRTLPAGLYLPYWVNPSLNFRGDYSTQGVLMPLGRGAIYGAGEQRTVPGIGRFNAAVLGWERQVTDRLQLQLWADALKMNTTFFSGQSFGLSGHLLYQPTDNLYFRTFGGMGFDNFSGHPAYNFGGTMGFDITERFGMELGAQTYFNTLTGRWEVSPIVAPYYKFPKFKLQIDVGPIIREVLRNVILDARGGNRRSGPTIMPDVPGFRH